MRRERPVGETPLRRKPTGAYNSPLAPSIKSYLTPILFQDLAGSKLVEEIQWAEALMEGVVFTADHFSIGVRPNPKLRS